MPLIVLCFDQLPTSLLGPYGNTLFSTPAFDELSGSGFTLEYAFRSNGKTHPLQDLLETSASQFGLWVPNPKDWKDDHQTRDKIAEKFGCLWEGNWKDDPESTEPQSDWTDTEQAQHFLDALSAIGEYTSSDHQPTDLIWIDMPALSCRWDAPEEWSKSLLGEEESTEVPDFDPKSIQESSQWDPDFLASVLAKAGGQTLLLDHCLETFLEAVSDKSNSLVVTARQGFSFGEHQFVGPASQSPFAEQTHVPFFIRPAGGLNCGVRIPGTHQAETWLQWLVEESSLPVESSIFEPERFLRSSVEKFQWTKYSLFSSRFSQVSGAQSAGVRNTAISFGEKSCLIRTDHWTYRHDQHTETSQLFVRPGRSPGTE